MPMYDKKYSLGAAKVFKDGVYSTDEVDFGVANPNLGKSGMFGLHMVVTTAFAEASEGLIFWVMNAATETSTVKHMGRFLTLASLTLGKHFFIPCGHTLLQFARARCDKVTTDEVTGQMVMWFGPDEDGAE